IADQGGVGQPRDAVGDEPQREQQADDPLGDAGVGQQGDAGHDAEDARHQRHHRPEAGKAFLFDVDDDVADAGDDGSHTVDHRNAGKDAAGAQAGERPQHDQAQPHDELADAKAGTASHPSHCAAPPSVAMAAGRAVSSCRSSCMNSSPVMVSFSYRYWARRSRAARFVSSRRFALACWALTRAITLRSMACWVSAEQAREVSPPRYWLFTVSKATMSKSSFMP